MMVIGSHDLLLDVLADLMPSLHPHMFLSSTHVGSMGGLMALRRGEAHVAPVHLLDQKTGIYNISYLEKLFHEPVLLVKGVKRIQGLIVKKGNPRNIKGIRDLPGLRYVNRQRGAGTRILFDYLLSENGLVPEEIEGYTYEAVSYTHLDVYKRQVLQEENVRLMKENGKIVLLTASPETIYGRVKDSRERPLLNNNMNMEFIAGLLEKRRPKYLKAADIIIDTDGRDVADICEELIEKVAGSAE